MIPKENYFNIIKDDVILATSLFNQMNIKDRAIYLLYFLDNCYDVTEKNFKDFMLASKTLLEKIKIANKAVNGDDEKLVEMVVELYLKEFPKEMKQEVPDNVVNKFYVLIKKNK